MGGGCLGTAAAIQVLLAWHSHMSRSRVSDGLVLVASLGNAISIRESGEVYFSLVCTEGCLVGTAINECVSLDVRQEVDCLECLLGLLCMGLLCTAVGMQV